MLLEAIVKVSCCCGGSGGGLCGCWMTLASKLSKRSNGREEAEFCSFIVGEVLGIWCDSLKCGSDEEVRMVNCARRARRRCKTENGQCSDSDSEWCKTTTTMMMVMMISGLTQWMNKLK